MYIFCICWILVWIMKSYTVWSRYNPSYAYMINDQYIFIDVGIVMWLQAPQRLKVDTKANPRSKTLATATRASRLDNCGNAYFFQPRIYHSFWHSRYFWAHQRWNAQVETSLHPKTITIFCSYRGASRSTADLSLFLCSCHQKYLVCPNT